MPFEPDNTDTPDPVVPEEEPGGGNSSEEIPNPTFSEPERPPSAETDEQA